MDLLLKISTAVSIAIDISKEIKRMSENLPSVTPKSRSENRKITTASINIGKANIPMNANNKDTQKGIKIIDKINTNTMQIRSVIYPYYTLITKIQNFSN